MVQYQLQMASTSRTDRIQQRDEMLNKIPIFLAKTYRIVDNPEYRDTIEWTQDGQAFIVKNITKLTTEVFTQHFKHNNFLSFIRQLNMYGFHKIVTNQDNEGSVFKHEYFKRDDFSMLPLIKRNNVNNESAGDSQQIVALPNRQEQLEKQVRVLRGQHEQLQAMMEVLMEQNKSITAQNKTFLNVMTDMKEKYRKKLETLMILFLFGNKNKNNDYLFPPQLNNLIEAFQQMNNGHALRMLPLKKRKQSSRALPMLTQGQDPIFHSDHERSQIASNFDKEESEDIFKVISRSPYKQKVKGEEQEKIERDDDEEWQNGIPISPLSARSVPPVVHDPNEWERELRRLEHSDCEVESEAHV